MNVIHLSSRQPLAAIARLHNRYYDIQPQEIEQGEGTPGWVYLTPLFAGFALSALLWALRP